MKMVISREPFQVVASLVIVCRFILINTNVTNDNVSNQRYDSTEPNSTI